MQKFQEVFSDGGKSIIKINDLEYAQSLSDDDSIKQRIEKMFNQDFVYRVIDHGHDYLVFLHVGINISLSLPEFHGDLRNSYNQRGYDCPAWFIKNIAMPKAQRVKLYSHNPNSIKYGFPVNDIVKEVMVSNRYILWHPDIDWTDDLITHIASTKPEYMENVPYFDERHLIIAVDTMLELMKCGRVTPHQLRSFLEMVHPSGKYMMRHFDTIKEIVANYPNYWASFIDLSDITDSQYYELEKISVNNDWSRIAYVKKQTPELVEIALNGSLSAWALVHRKTKKLKEMAKRGFPELGIS